MGILEDVPIKVGKFYVSIDCVILDMAENSYSQIILDRPFLATAGCKIDVKKGRLTFDMGENHVEFGVLKIVNLLLLLILVMGAIDLNGLVHLIDMIQNNPSSFNCALFEGQ